MEERGCDWTSFHSVSPSVMMTESDFWSINIEFRRRADAAWFPGSGHWPRISVHLGPTSPRTQSAVYLCLLTWSTRFRVCYSAVVWTGWCERNPPPRGTDSKGHFSVSRFLVMDWNLCLSVNGGGGGGSTLMRSSSRGQWSLDLSAAGLPGWVSLPQLTQVNR